MKTIFSIIVFLSFVLPAQAAVELRLLPESHVWLTGNSTLHPYASTSTLTQVHAELLPSDLKADATPAALAAEVVGRGSFRVFDVVIPVVGLKSGESGLDKNMAKALKAKTAPDIRFVLSRYEAGALESDNERSFSATGSLSIAGVQAPVVLKGKAQSGAGTVGVRGDYTLRMSDYGVKPPTLLLGAIKVADPVTIHFNLTFQLNQGENQ